MPFWKKPDQKQQAKHATAASQPDDSKQPKQITKEHWAIYSKELKDDFVPQPSKRTRRIKKFWKQDGDTWIEVKVFTGRVKKRTKEPVFRSLFYSVKLKIAYWDEPPTGATTVIWSHNNRVPPTPPLPSAPPEEHLYEEHLYHI